MLTWFQNIGLKVAIIKSEFYIIEISYLNLIITIKEV